MDAIPHVTPQTNTYCPAEGLSLLHGRFDDLLANPWEAPSPAGSQPSLQFNLPPIHPAHRAGFQVTLPLANTLFDNGRPHTLFASRWFHGKLGDVIERTTQPVMPRFDSGGQSRVSTPLVPVTKARRVVGGLGNILRQVEIDGLMVPASKELEEVIPRLLSTRTDGGLPGPMGVWAFVYPERIVKDVKFPNVLEVGVEGEWERAREVEGVMGDWLAGGCHLRRIRKLAGQAGRGRETADVYSKRRRRLGTEAGTVVSGSPDQVLDGGSRRRREFYPVVPRRR